MAPERRLPVALSWGRQTNGTRTRGAAGGRTFDLPSSSTGRCGRRGETERERMCERQPDGQPLPGAGGLGPGASCCSPLRGEVLGQAWGARRLPPSRPAGWRVLCIREGPLARVMPWGIPQGGGGYGVGPAGAVPPGSAQGSTFPSLLLQLQRVRRLLLDLMPGALVLCAGRGERGCWDGGRCRGAGKPRPTRRPHLSRDPCPAGWLTSSSPRCAPATG